MEVPHRSFTVLLLILSVAVSPLGQCVQAEPYYPDGEHLDHNGRTSDRQADDGTGPVEPDSVHLKVDVSENGTAHWRIVYRIRLDDSATERMFHHFEQSVRDEPGNTSQEFYDRIRQSVEAAEEVTGRDMSAARFDVNMSVRRIAQKYGVIVYSFRWHGFGTVSEGGLQVGDALGGFFLGPNERLSISWPEAYGVADVEPDPDVQQEDRVVWHGPVTFGSDGPRVHLTKAAELNPWLPLSGVVTVLVLATLFGLARRNGSLSLGPLGGGASDDSDEATELLSNEERVIRLLEKHGGRAKQQQVADELGWTKTKTSYVVSNLRQDDRIRSFRLGRENVLLLPEAQDIEQGEA